MVPPTPTDNAAGGACTFCGLSYMGRPNQCGRCGSLLNDAAEDAKRMGAEARKGLSSRRALADLLFLLGLLLGGPMIAIGGQLRLGLFIALAGGLASVLYRYSNLSGPGSVIVGGVGAAIVATSLIDAPSDADELAADAETREAFVSALDAPERDVFAEARGPGSVAVWFTVSADVSHECGDYPTEAIRTHLRDLGFARVVVVEQNQSGGLCSFAP